MSRSHEKANDEVYDEDEEYKGNPEGEVMAFMRDMKKESKNMMTELIDIDDLLSKLKIKIAEDSTSKKELYRIIDSIRLRIGVMEREDRIELNEEEEAETLLEKLKKWVDQIV
ncbi:hypothetical protein JXB28_01655 [Candidatus Woesearchaeota archaeon]|nr:hypothetical protein [Candidatus Woesearchaeota archaeon]